MKERVVLREEVDPDLRQSDLPDGPFQGWQRYPANVSGFDNIIDDAKTYQDLLGHLESVLFSEKVEIEVIDANFSGAILAFDRSPEHLLLTIPPELGNCTSRFATLTSEKEGEAFFSQNLPALRIM